MMARTRSSANLALVEGEHHETLDRLVQEVVVMSHDAGWATLVGEGGSSLSGGERQRVSIARALLKDAPIVVLDEATAALDPENEALIEDAMATLAELWAERARATGWRVSSAVRED